MTAQRPVARDKAILQAALDLFSERGFAATGVDEIGARAGVSGPAIYRHFSGKAELLATLVDQAMDHLLTLTSPDGGGDDELERLVAGHVRFALSDRKLLAMYTVEERSLGAEDRRRARRRQREYVERWVGTLGRRYPDASQTARRGAAHGAIGLIQSVMHWPQGVVADPDTEWRIARQAFGGLAAALGEDGGGAGGLGAQADAPAR